MAIEQETITTDSPSLDDLRAFLSLPIDERRRILANQAAQMLNHYEDDEARKEREEWQGGDIVEY